MKQNVVVLRELPNGNVVVTLKRPTACGGDCGSCGGCAAPDERVTVEAVNPIGAKAGDRVVIESSTRSILGLAVLVYLMPLAFFFLFYAVSPSLCGAGLAIGIGALIPFNKLVSKKRLYTIVNLTKQGE